MFGSSQKKVGHCPHLGCWFGANRRFRTAASVQGVHFQRCGPDSVAQPLKSGGGKSLITMQTSKICCLDTDGLPQTTRDTTELIKSRARPFSKSRQPAGEPLPTELLSSRHSSRHQSG